MAAAALPDGWTTHELNGSRFYYHRASNTVQAEAPQSSGSSTDAPPSEPPACSQPELQEDVEKAQELSPSDMAPSTPPLPQWHDQALYAFAPPAAEAPPAGSAPPLPLQASSVFQAPPPPQGAPPPTILSVTPPAPTTWHKLNVLVPEPGLRAGQQLAFTTPAGNGLLPQKLSVRVEDAVAPGSMIMVQYPGLPAPSIQVPTSPQPEMAPVQVTLDEDRRAMRTSWWLYGLGWAMMCVAPLFGLTLWLAAALTYFCKPRAVRTRRQGQRCPACASAITMLVLVALACVVAAVGAIDPHATHRHHHSHRHWYHAAPAAAGSHHHGWLRGAGASEMLE